MATLGSGQGIMDRIPGTARSSYLGAALCAAFLAVGAPGVPAARLLGRATDME